MPAGFPPVGAKHAKNAREDDVRVLTLSSGQPPPGTFVYAACDADGEHGVQHGHPLGSFVSAAEQVLFLDRWEA